MEERAVGREAAVTTHRPLVRALPGAGGVRIGGMIALVAVLPGILFAVVGGFIAVAGTPALGVPISALGVIVIILAQVVISAMRAIFSVAMLHYVEDRQGFGPFDAAALQSAVRVK